MWYEKLFKNYANTYDQESFTSGTLGECDFLEKELNGDRSQRILDIGCGTGRHCIEMAKRGYHMTGIDLSPAQIEHAKQKAKEQDVTVDFHVMDARNLSFSHAFDAAIMLCEGGFPLMETDEMNYQILECARNALKDNGKLIFTTLNGLFPLFHRTDDFCNDTCGQTKTVYRSSGFDLMTLRDCSTITITDDEGVTQTLECNERYYMPSEITWLLKSLGFHKVDIYGAILGEFSRNHVLQTQDYEMLVIAENFLQPT